MTDRELMQQALDALLTCTWSKETDDAIAALRERLAQPKQEPVQTMSHGGRPMTMREIMEAEEPAQPEHEPVDSAEKAGAYMNERLWEFIDMAAAWPKAKPDPRTWDHVMVYAPKQPQMQPCAGRNCGSTNPNLHSAECFEDYDKATGMAAQQPGIEELEHENRLMRARNERLQAEVERMEQEQTVAWTPVTEAMPKPMVRVLIYYKTSAGFGRRIRGEWIPAKTEEATAENENGEYDEEADTYWIPEGWYECIDNWDAYSSVKVCEGEVTHWMPLPPAPIVEGKPDAA